MSWGQLRKAWEVTGTRLSEAAWPAFDPESLVKVWQCGSCGFEFSDPSFAGNGQFYKELQAQNEYYYPDASPEFIRAAKFAVDRKIKNALDVGCGAGAFLNLLKGKGIKTYGIELNPEAARISRGAGHEVFETLLEDLPADQKFELVTAWQVLEHVSAPREFLEQCVRVLAPGGFVGVAVPNERTMRWICPHDPHGWPPHHISRWQLRDLERIGKEVGLRMIQSGAEALHGASGEHFWMLHNKLAATLGFKPHPGGAWLPKLLWFLYRKAGLRHYCPLPGSSIYAFYVRE
jgi:SAM-dependent methyltransferase